MITQAQAWAWYFSYNPLYTVLTGQNFRERHWPPHLAYVPDDDEPRCNSEECWCHIGLETGEV